MTQTAPPSNRSTYLTNASGWNAHSMIFRRRNAVPRIGRDNGKLWPSATPISSRKRRDFLHKLSNYYATEYDLVAVEGLDAKELVELPGNSRNRAGAAWGTFLRMLEYKCEREGTHFAEVDQGTRRKRARLAASRRTSRCGFVNTRVPRVGLRRTGTRTQRGTFFLAVLKI